MKNKIITISREFGSGGRELGKRLSDCLGFPYFDREILEELSRRLHMDEDYVEKITMRSPLDIPLHFSRSFSTYSAVSKETVEVLGVQHKLLREIAERESCIIVGRGANAILRGHEPFNIFVYADNVSKIYRCRERENGTKTMTERELLNKMREIDRSRSKTQELFSSAKWGDKSAYHLCINTGGQEIKNLIPAISNYISAWFGGRD